MALLCLAPFAARAQEAAGGVFLDPLAAGSFGFRLREGPALAPLVGVDVEGRAQSLEPGQGLPFILALIDPASDGAKALLSELGEVAEGNQGRLKVGALALASSFAFRSRLQDYRPAIPLLCVGAFPEGLGGAVFPRFYILASDGRIRASRSGSFSWKGAEGQAFLGALLRALPPDPTKAGAFLGQPELEVLRELNRARANPQAYAERIRDYEFHLSGQRLSYPGEADTRLTEGFSAAEEAIAFLQVQVALPPLEASPGLCSASAAYAGGGALLACLEAAGSWQGTFASASYQGSPSPENLVVRLIVDDGKPGRPDRAAIFSRDHRLVGLAGPSAAHPENAWSLVFAWGFEEKSSVLAP